MKKATLQTVLLLFLLVPALITRAQVTKTLNGTVTYESGMSKSTLTTPNGNVTVNLPGLTGNVLTGTVSTEPAGKTNKEKKRNLEDLLKMVLVLNGQRIALSQNPRTFDCTMQEGGVSRTPLELINESGSRLASVSLPPVLSKPSITGGTPKLTAPSNILIRGDALNIYTDQEFSVGEKFRLTDSKGKQFIIQPICLSSQQAVLSLPVDVIPGECVITESDQPSSHSSGVRVNVMDMELSSPNTNLRPGQLSEVLLTLHTAPAKVSTRPGAGNFTIDLENLNPDIVTMENGNVQRITSGQMNYDAGTNVYQIKKIITGKNTGAFSVNAILHEDYNTGTDPFRPQENVLQTPLEFNDWAEAIKNDLQEYAAMQPTDALGQSTRANAMRAINNFPVCSDLSDLDECKSIAENLLRPLKVPMGAAISWVSSYEAAKAAAKALEQSPGDNLSMVDYDVLKNGLEFMKRVGESDNDVSLINDCTKAQELIENIQTGSVSNSNLPELRNLINAVIVTAGRKISADKHITQKTGMKNLKEASLQLPSLAQPGNVHPFNDLIGLLNPVSKTLLAVPGREEEVLRQFQAIPVSNGMYKIQTVNIFNRPVAMNVTLTPTVLLNIQGYSEEFLDSLDSWTRADTSMGILTHRFFDTTAGTWSRVFRYAECKQIRPETTGYCFRSENLMSNYRITTYAVSQCKKGMGSSCVEVFCITQRKTYYFDRQCQQEIPGTEYWYAYKCR